jgi:hypothetical protein
MPFTRDRFLSLRPWLYHFTTPRNADLLRDERAMLSAACWIDRANAFRPQVENTYEYLGTARVGCRTLEVGHGRTVTLRFCRYNSGAPRARTNAPRGPHIFVTCDAADYDVPGVAEVVFPDRIYLPPGTQWKPPGEGATWEPLFAPDASLSC